LDKPLLPRRTWPWPDLDARIAEVAAWSNAGTDLHRPLRLLTWPVVRRTNAGFIPALLSHGVPVPQDIVLHTRDVLHRLVESNTPTWPRFARWLAELDHDFAVGAFRDLALTRTSDPERYRAWAFLHETSLEDSVEVGEQLITDPHVTRTTRFRIGDHLAEFNLDTALTAFDRVTHNDLRNQAAEFIAKHTPDRAIDLYTATASDPSVPDTHRLEASRQVLSHRRDTGLDLHFSLLTTTVRTHVMDDLRREVPHRLTTRLNQLYRTGPPATRLDFARYLVTHLSGGPEVMTTLATDPSQSPESQFHALNSDPRAATPELLTTVITCFTTHNQTKVDALTLLAKLSPDTAQDLLTTVITNKNLPFHTRLEAVIPPSHHLGQHRTTALYRLLATEDGATSAQRNSAIRKTARPYDLLRDLATSPSLTYLQRKPFLTKLPRTDRITALTTIINSPAEKDTTKLTAATALGRLDKNRAALSLTAMADDPALPRSVRNRARTLARQFS